MKILYITPDISGSGGIARVIATKTDFLISKYNYEITIFAPNYNAATIFFNFNAKIQWQTIQEPKYTVAFFSTYINKINTLISEIKPDWIVVCDAFLWFLIPYFIKSNCSVLFETHVSKFLKKDSEKNIKTKLLHFLKKRALKKFDKVVFLTKDASEEWKLQNSVIIPNSLSFIPNKKANLENKKALAIARHSPEKGIDRLLHIWKKVVQKHPDWQLDIYGEFNESVTYYKLSEELEITKNVNFLLPTNSIQEVYLNSSLYLMTSRSEVFPLVLLEAIACGLPCIAYDCQSGPRNIISNDSNGYLIADNKEDDFVEKCNLIIEDKLLKKRLANSSDDFIKKYNLNAIMNLWIALFEAQIKTKN